MATRKAALRALVLLGLATFSICQTDVPIVLELGSDLTATHNASLGSGGRQVFVLDSDSGLRTCLGLTSEATAARRFIHAELWDKDAMFVGKEGESSNNQDSLARGADPMLMLANSRIPPHATYQTHQSDWIWSPPNTITDYEGYRLLRGYHHVVVEINGTHSNSDPWYLTIANIEIWMMHTLDYTLRVSCVEEPPCPSLSYAEPCSGHGQCSAGRCVCDMNENEAWGDVACDVKVEPLQNGIAVPGSQIQGTWNYYTFLVPERSNMLLVDMDRIRGDPVLFVKHQDSGFARDGLPAVLDYDLYADQDSFRSRLNFHHITISQPRPGIYYVGVYNNDVYIKEPAAFRVTAQWATEPGEGFCPADCNAPQGTCQGLGSSMVCECAEGFGGDLCEGESKGLMLGSVAVGVLSPAQWVYYSLTLNSSNYRWWKDGLVVDFTTNDQGHPVLILKRDAFPTMLENDYIFTSSQMLQGRKRFKLAKEELMEGEYIFGIFNMDYYRHHEMEFGFMVSSVDNDSLMPFTPYMSIVLGVTVSLFLCLFMSICKRLIQRHGLFGHQLPEHLHHPAHFTTSMRENVCRGVDRAVVDGFPSYSYKPPDTDEEAAKTPDSDDLEINSEGLPSCAVCLCAYEEGEMMRRLPCNHEFHLKCIDQWLTQRTTCPMCRVALVSEGDDAPNGRERPNGGSSSPRGNQGTPVAADSPPGTAIAANDGDERPQGGPARYVELPNLDRGAPSNSSAVPTAPPAPTHLREMLSDVTSEEAHPTAS